MSLFSFHSCDGSLIVAIEGKGIFEGESNLLKKLSDPQRVEQARVHGGIFSFHGGRCN